ncbi:hypothetical protein ASE86_14090 [Sphingomonas sp. Leaf33]|uniref:hypothetical protein n=1 Tax=Sphingomonas sp. Leaf33 TaxID=1736215 RepID=UPI0006FA17EA|nr:hypothetical protein [Sphingomonas sp. Leaf33]KQN19580.1 hypothetical protein ASE86_14090 [Sphingomonas sp. Leaf33]
MLDVVVALLLTWGALALAGDTPAGRALRRMLVDRPAARLSRITRGHVTLAIVLFGGTGLIVAVLGHEGARIIAMGLPELASWITMFEVTAYLDAAVAVVTAVSMTRIAGLRAWVRTLPLPGRARGRAPRRQRTAQRLRKPANDDEPGWAVAA